MHVDIQIRPPKLPRDVLSIIIGALFNPPKSHMGQDLVEHIAHTIDFVFEKYPHTVDS